MTSSRKKNQDKEEKSPKVHPKKRVDKKRHTEKKSGPLGLKSNPYSEQEDKYKVVSPPPTVDPYRGVNWRSILKKSIFMFVLIASLFLSWPFWSKLIVPFLSLSDYEFIPDSEVKKLSDRIIELEVQVKGVSRDFESIAEMERERQRLQNGVKKILGRLGALETALSDAKEMFAEAGVKLDKKKAQSMFDQLTKRILQLEQEGIAGGTLVGRLERLESMDPASRSLALEQVEDKNLRLESIINNLRERLEKIESPNRSNLNDSRIAAVVLGVSQLRKIVLSGQPFAEELKALRLILVSEGGIKAPLVTLEKYGAEGVETIFLLSKQFNKIANKLVITSSTGEEVGGWYENFVNKIATLVSIRRIDGKAPPESIDSYIFQAEQYLKNNNLVEAKRVVKKIKRLFPMVSETVNPWLAVVDKRLSAERAVRSLHVTAITMIARTKK